ncbi:hypothetical protein MMC13_000465 [Lambiella insularis]|nr:hypothetical protein [Lambiella insularis]
MVNHMKKPFVSRSKFGPKQKPGPRGKHHEHPLHICMICNKGYSRRWTLKGTHFARCVRLNGNPNNYQWDTHPSCWHVDREGKSTGPSGELADGTDENGQLRGRAAQWQVGKRGSSRIILPLDAPIVGNGGEMEDDDVEMGEEDDTSQDDGTLGQDEMRRLEAEPEESQRSLRAGDDSSKEALHIAAPEPTRPFLLPSPFANDYGSHLDQPQFHRNPGNHVSYGQYDAPLMDSFLPTSVSEYNEAVPNQAYSTAYGDFDSHTNSQSQSFFIPNSMQAAYLNLDSHMASKSEPFFIPDSNQAANPNLYSHTDSMSQPFFIANSNQTAYPKASPHLYVPSTTHMDSDQEALPIRRLPFGAALNSSKATHHDSAAMPSSDTLFGSDPVQQGRAEPPSSTVQPEDETIDPVLVYAQLFRNPNAGAAHGHTDHNERTVPISHYRPQAALYENRLSDFNAPGSAEHQRHKILIAHRRLQAALSGQPPHDFSEEERAEQANYMASMSHYGPQAALYGNHPPTFNEPRVGALQNPTGPISYLNPGLGLYESLVPISREARDRPSKRIYDPDTLPMEIFQRHGLVPVPSTSRSTSGKPTANAVTHALDEQGNHAAPNSLLERQMFSTETNEEYQERLKKFVAAMPPVRKPKNKTVSAEMPGYVRPLEGKLVTPIVMEQIANVVFVACRKKAAEGVSQARSCYEWWNSRLPPGAFCGVPRVADDADARERERVVVFMAQATHFHMLKEINEGEGPAEIWHRQHNFYKLMRGLLGELGDREAQGKINNLFIQEPRVDGRLAIG